MIYLERLISILLIILLVNSSSVIYGQYDVDQDGNDKLIGIGSNPVDGAPLWTIGDLAEGQTSVFAKFGQERDFPIFGAWETDGPPAPAVIREEKPGAYDLIFINQACRLKGTPETIEAILTGDIDGDRVTDIVVTHKQKKERVWTVY